MSDLIQRLNGLCDEQPFHTGWYFKDLKSGQAADRSGAKVVPSASTRKIAILMAALREVHRGRFSLDQPFTIEAKYQHTTSGIFQHFTPGSSFPLRDALVGMIVVSDNTCTGKIADMIGLDVINEFSRSVGMVGTTHRHSTPPGNLGFDHPVEATNATTPSDVGRLLELILRGTQDAGAAEKLGSTTELVQLGLDILSWQKLNQRMPYLLPGGVKVAHKTGTGARNYNDAGIVFAGDEARFILTVYTDGVPATLPDGTAGHSAADLLIAHLARACWDDLVG
ncbi:MAG TPA: serine hydrolase [Thermomicrobiaceae bacterium]|nr:serine hydrolase [Thermomicrobiaceae bacterium]